MSVIKCWPCPLQMSSVELPFLMDSLTHVSYLFVQHHPKSTNASSIEGDCHAFDAMLSWFKLFDHV